MDALPPVLESLPLGALSFLFVVAVCASAVNTVAGAGSLLLLPALIFSGLDASSANATNRIGILVQTGAAIAGFRRAGLSIGEREARLTAVTMVGGALGSFLATLLEPRGLQLAIVIAMALVLVATLAPRPRSLPDAPPPLAAVPRPDPKMLAGFFVIGVYGGFLQAGVGILALLFLSRGYGMSLVAGNVLKVVVTFGLTVVALGVFAARGETLDAPRGAVLAVGAAIGGYFGADVAVRLGETWTRRAIVVAVIASIAKLAWDLAPST